MTDKRKRRFFNEFIEVGKTRRSYKFMQMLDSSYVDKQLLPEAKKRGVTLQQLLRAVVVPEWVECRARLLKEAEAARARAAETDAMRERLLRRRRRETRR